MNNHWLNVVLDEPVVAAAAAVVVVVVSRTTAAQTGSSEHKLCYTHTHRSEATLIELIGATVSAALRDGHLLAS